MATHIRLTRIGKKKRPYYRIVVLDSRKKRDGSYIENLGTYQPMETDESKTKIDLEKYDAWVSKGAVASGVVKNIVKKQRRQNA